MGYKVSYFYLWLVMRSANCESYYSIMGAIFPAELLVRIYLDRGGIGRF